MAKHLTSQRYIYKLHTSRLKRANWNLTLKPNQARQNQEVIALSESQMLRFIDEINGVENVEEKIRRLKLKIKRLQKQQSSDIFEIKKQIKEAYDKLDEYQFKNDYICVVIDDTKHYHTIYKNGFVVNGIIFRRFLGTTGGI